MTIAFVRTVLLYIIVLERCAAVGEINHDVRCGDLDGLKVERRRRYCEVVRSVQ
jgi:hypothetical protein